MEIIAILGSRNPEGRTATATNALMKGFEDRGWEKKEVFLTHRQIERCRQCDDDGWGECREGRCIIDDDFASIVEEIRESDAVVFATPVYYSDLSESMRAFLDRLRRICRVNKDRVEGKPAFGISVAGGGGGGAPACSASLVGVMRRCGFDVLDVIPARRQNLDLKLELLGATGRWFADSLGS